MIGEGLKKLIAPIFTTSEGCIILNYQALIPYQNHIITPDFSAYFFTFNHIIFYVVKEDSSYLLIDLFKG